MSLSLYLIFGVSALLLAWIGTGAAMLALTRAGVMDTPGARSNHAAPVPRGGGIAVVAALLLLLPAAGTPNGILGGILVLAAVSFLDDRRGVSPVWRLLAHALAVAMAVGGLPQPIVSPALPVALDGALAMLLWLWMINLTNFMDGIDGITGAQVISIALGVVAVALSAPAFHDGIALDAVIAGAAAAGFLWWNWRPARIFLGDVGSVPLGFVLGFLLLALAAQGYGKAALILPAYYLTDATLTLAKRALEGQRVWEAHSEHAYQRAVRGGLAHDAVVLRMTALNLVLIVLAVASVTHPALGVAALAAAYAAALGLFLHFRSAR